jgi:hypothetical protein
MRIQPEPMAFDASVNDVFDFLADCENERAWNPDLKDIRRITSGPLGAGTEWDGTYRGMGTMRIRLDDYTPNRRLAFTTTGSRMAMSFVFTFTGDDRHTQAAIDADVTPKGAMRLVAPLLGPMMRRTFARRPTQMREGLATFRAQRAGR